MEIEGRLYSLLGGQRDIMKMLKAAEREREDAR